MRIRKNSRLVFNGGSSASSPSSTRSRSFLVCQLNRSPWDVESFSPQDYSFALNGSLGESHLASDRYSLVSGESMELSFEYVENPPVSKENSENGDDEITGLDEAITTPFCDRVDGSGWHCDRLAKQGHTMCDYHQLSYHSVPPPPPNRKAVVVQPPQPPPPTAPKRRGRPRKVEAVVASNNPYEFYYYSGFGPRWAKKRGGEVNGGESSAKKSEKTDVYENNGEEIQGVLSTTMSEHDIDIDIYNNNNNDDDNDNTKKMDNGNRDYIETVIDEELDYIDDDDDEDDDKEMYGRRRARKPIKARSLKSLM